MTADGPPRLVRIGRVVGVRGLDGSLKIHAYTRDRTGVFEYRRWLLETGHGAAAYELESGGEQGRGLTARLRGVEDRDTALALVGASIYVGVDQLPVLADGEFFWHQLEGLKVQTLGGACLGTVDHLLETGANDVLVVKGERERLIPYTEAVVKEVDLEAGVMRVDWDPAF